MAITWKKIAYDGDAPTAHSIASHNDTTGTGAELDALTDNSMADALHRHSELSASDGTPDKVVYCDTDGILYADKAPTGLDVQYGAEVGTHLTVGNNITVGGTVDGVDIAALDSAVVKKATLTTKGDIYAATGAATVIRLAVGGTDGHVLTVDSGEASGLKYAAGEGVSEATVIAFVLALS